MDSSITFIILCLIIMIFLFVELFRPKQNVNEKIANTKRLLENLFPAAVHLIVEAEQKYGSATTLKGKSFVIDNLYLRIPDEYKMCITEKNLEMIFLRALDLVYGDSFEN